MPRITGNKGEWSELYALIKLLSLERLYAADENVNRLENIYFPILKILRSENNETDIEYVIQSEDGSVEVHCDHETIRTVPHDALRRMASYLYSSINQGTNRAFEIENVDRIMDELACTRIAAPSSDKTDITMQLHDINTGYESIYGFSIKSELGNPFRHVKRIDHQFCDAPDPKHDHGDPADAEHILFLSELLFQRNFPSFLSSPRCFPVLKFYPCKRQTVNPSETGKRLLRLL